MNQEELKQKLERRAALEGERHLLYVASKYDISIKTLAKLVNDIHKERTCTICAECKHDNNNS